MPRAAQVGAAEVETLMDGEPPFLRALPFVLLALGFAILACGFWELHDKCDRRPFLPQIPQQALEP